MKTINVLVRDKIASAVGDIVYICGNSDYVVSFDFDEEWDAYGVKTARFVHDGSYIDIVFTGNQCAMPVIHKAYGIYVGVYAGDLRTTTPAHIPSTASILSAEGTPEEPPADVYAQITALCEDALATAKSVRDDADAGKFDGAPGKTPVAGKDYFTEADKQAIAGEAAEAVGFPQPTASDIGKFLGCEDGKAAWLPLSGGGGGTEDTLRLVVDTTTEEDVAEILFTEDMDGKPLSMKKFIFNVIFPAASGSADALIGAGDFRFFAGVEHLQNGWYSAKSITLKKSEIEYWGEISQHNEKSGLYAILEKKAYGGKYSNNSTASDGGTYHRMELGDKNGPYNGGTYYVHETIDLVFLKNSTTVLIPAGTKIKIWGVDA